MKPFALMSASLIVLSVMGLTGCAVTAPVQGKAEIARHENAGFPDKTRVSLGPRRLLDYLTEHIVATAPQLKPVDGLLFRDTAFPQGGWHLQSLLEAGNRTRIVQELQVDHLVLVTPLVYTVGDESGFFVPLVVGAQSADHKASLSATVYDMKSGSALRRIDSTAIGKERVYSYVILFSGTTPHVVTPMLDALVKEIVAVLDKANTHAPSRISILAAEVPESHE